MKTKKKKIEVDSTVNQQIKGKFVAREVLTCFSYEMDAVLKQGANGGNSDLPDYEQIENLYEYKCPECGEGEQDREELLCDNESSTGNDYNFKCKNCGHESDQDDWNNEPQEILEWWIITRWFYEKLKAKGQPVLQWGNNHYWGRCCSGQAILLDGVISEICLEMKILEGQANDWSK